MKRALYLFCFIAGFAFSAQAQTFTIVSPEGLTAPFEVAPGTDVTFQWYYFDEAPTAFYSYTEAPVFPGFGTDPLWTEHTDFVNNGDGTYNTTITVNEPLWVWGGFYASFIGQWTFSEVIQINIASGVVLNVEDGLLCNDGMDTELLTLEQSYESHQWFFDGEEIAGAVDSSYVASQPGAYKAVVVHEGDTLSSNIVNLSYLEISMEGQLSGDGTQLILTTNSGLDTYQWLSGPDENTLSPIDGATQDTFYAPITETMTYYAATATLGDCTVQSASGPVSQSLFTIPVIMVSADTNSYGVVCEGTSVTLSIDDAYDTYKWLRDGNNAWNESNMITINQAYQEGAYTIEVSNNEWPDIVITSEAFDLNYFDVIEPQLTGVANYQDYCPGDELNVILADEGYTYNWYVHQNYNYSDEDLIDVEGAIYSFTFDTATYITVVAEYQGCQNDKRISLGTYEGTYISANPDDYDQTYLCTDSTVTLAVPSYQAGDFQDFQWYLTVEDTLQIIEGADTSFYEVTEPGVYSIQASVAACPAAVALSNGSVIRDYTEREIYVWATAEEICVGEEVTINISGGNWTSIQWFEEYIDFGDVGYDELFQPIIGAGTEPSQVVTEFNSYLVKAKHKSCPNGLKTISSIITVRPKVNPTIAYAPDYPVNGWHVAAIDSIAAVAYCQEEPVSLSLPDHYDSYSWHSLLYAGDRHYALGNPIEGANTDSLDILADGAIWYTVVVDSAGCVGYSDAIIVDTWAFLSPVITSYNNSELCNREDSALIHLSFPGEWESFQWYLDGEPIPDSNNDSLWVTEEGQYVLNANPSLCPQFEYSSGVGPTFQFMYAEIAENDSLIWAMPQLGFYEYQWYLDGEPIEAGPAPWILRKEDMLPGEYTVEVTNPEPCTKLSDPYVWVVDAIDDYTMHDLKLYPNPTQGVVYLDGIDENRVEQIKVFNIYGAQLQQLQARSSKLKLDLSSYDSGMYLLQVVLKDGSSFSLKVNRS